MSARSASISPRVGRVASNEARAVKATMHCCADDSADLARTWAARTWAFMISGLSLATPSRDDVGFIEEPQAAVPAQHVAGGVEIAAVVDDGGQAMVFNLGDVDRRVPGGKQGRGADRIRQFRGQRVHVVAKQRTIVGIDVEIELASGRAELLLDRLHDLVAVVDERIVAWPEALHDLKPRIVAVGMNGDEAAPRPERAGKRRNDPAGLELDRCTSPIGLGCDDKVVACLGAAWFRQDRIEQEAGILAKDNE